MYSFLIILSYSASPAEMGTPAKLQVILDEADVRKLFFPKGIPGTTQDLVAVSQDKLNVLGDFTLMYQDQEFVGQFFTLSFIDEVEDKGTLKVVQV